MNRKTLIGIIGTGIIIIIRIIIPLVPNQLQWPFITGGVILGLMISYLVANIDKPEGALFHIIRGVGAIITLISGIIVLMILSSDASTSNKLILSAICLIPNIITIIIFKCFPSKQEEIKNQLQLTEKDIKLTDDIMYALEETIHNLEQKRISKLPILILIILLFNAPFVFMLIDNNPKEIILCFLFTLFWFGCATCGAIWVSKKFLISDYKIQFKENIIYEIFKYLGGENIRYNSGSFIPKSHFQNSDLFRYFNNYTGDDLINGQINSLSFAASELHVNYTSGSGKNRSTETIFDGLFCVIDIPIKVQIPFGTNLDFGPEILFDNNEFNQLFKVFGEDTTEAFYIFSSKSLEKIVDFVYKTGRNFQFSFIDNRIYIALETNTTKQFFEPPLFKSLWDYRIYDEIIADFKFIVELLNSLEFKPQNLDIIPEKPIV